MRAQMKVPRAERAEDSMLLRRRPRPLPRLGEQGCILTCMVALMLLAGTMTVELASGRVTWVALVLPLLLAIGFALGVSAPRAALALIIVSILTEWLQPSLLRDGAIRLRLDEVVVVGVAAGVLLRVGRGSTGARSRLLASVPGLVPLLLFVVENVVVTVLGRKNVGYGFSLIAELAAGVLCYITIVLLLSEIQQPRAIILPLLMSAGIEACVGLGALVVSKVRHDPHSFGVHRDTTSHLVAPNGTMIEPNFFGQYLTAITIIAAALLLYEFTRPSAANGSRKLSRGTVLGLLGLVSVSFIGIVVSLTRASWFGLALGFIVVLLSWRAGRRRIEQAADQIQPVPALDGKERLDVATRFKPQARPRARRHLRPLVVGEVLMGVAAVIVALVQFTSEGEALAKRLTHLLDFGSGSAMGRILVLQLVLKDWQRSPILGLGTGSFSGHLPNVPPSSHVWIYSMGLAMLHDSGILGVAIFLVFLWSLYRRLWGTIAGAPGSRARAFAIGIFGAAIAMLFGAQATSTMYLMLLWVFLGLAAGIPALCASTYWRHLMWSGPAAIRDMSSAIIPPSPGVRSSRLPNDTIDSGFGPGIESGTHRGSAGSLALGIAAQRARVLHIYDTGILGGMQRILFATARGLSVYGWTSNAICGSDGPLAENLRNVGVKTTALPIAGRRRFARSFPLIFWHILRSRPDVVIVYGAVVGCVAGLAARLAGVRCIIYQSGSPTFYYNRTALKRLRNHLVERIACGCASAVWCVSRENRELYLANNVVSPDKCVEIPLCVSDNLVKRLGNLGNLDGRSPERSLPRQDQDQDQVMLRARLGLSSYERVIGYVGRLVPEKGVDVLLDAYAQLAAELPDTRLMLVGEGPEQAALERRAQQLGISQRVLFVGAQHDIVPFYLVSQVVVVPSLRETFGLVGVEALLARRPVVASWVGGLPEAVLDGVCGRLVPPGDAMALAEAIRWVMHAPGRAEELGRNGQQRALAEYNEGRMAARIDALLDAVLTIRARPWQTDRQSARRAGRGVDDFDDLSELDSIDGLDGLEQRRPLRHVLHVLDSGAIGGGPRVLTAAARGMKELNWISSVICGDNGPLASDLRAAGIATEALPINGQYRFLRGMSRLVSLMRRQRPDVVILYGPIAGCLGGLAARMAGVRGIVYGAGYPSYYADRGIWRRVRNAVVEKISCNCADVIWCKSNDDVKLYHRRKASRPEKFRLVPNCVSNDLLERLGELGMAEDSRADSLPRRLGLSSYERVIGYVGRLVPEKGVDVLLDAYAQLAAELPDTRLMLVGEGPEQAALERRAQQLGISQRVLFVGAQRDIVPFYLLAEVIAIPSRYEPFGNVAVEAMAGARPVVASRVGGLADTVLDGVCGRLVPPEDPTALAGAIRWVLLSGGQARELGRNGRHRALREYSEERLAERLDRLSRMALRARDRQAR